MKRSRNLLIVNYSMSANHPIFSHCVEIVAGLSEFFSKIHVITLGDFDASLPDNVTVVALGAERVPKILKLIALARAYFSFLRKEKNHILFCHMTERPFLLLAPISKLLKNKTYLWYAHTSKSLALFLSQPFASAYITSTKGSFPWKFKKLFFIGQGISSQQFQFHPKQINRFSNFIHIGRNDPSKNIDLLIDLFSIMSSREIITKDATITLLGNTSREYMSYKLYLNEKILSLSISERCIFETAVPRAQVVNFLREADVFLHAYLGSLDKTLLEATLCGVPVITCNREYLREFGSWSDAELSQSIDNCPDILIREFEGLVSTSTLKLKQELNRRAEIARNTHNLGDWLSRLKRILVA